MRRMASILGLALVAGCATRPAVAPEAKPARQGEVRGDAASSSSFDLKLSVRDPVLQQSLPTYMEAAMQHYRSAIATLPQAPERLRMWVFGTRDEWEEFTRGLLGHEAGTYLAIDRGGYTTEGEAVLYEIGPVDTLTIAAHEGWHQYTQATFRDTLPAWLEEGIACYMEGRRMSRGGRDASFRPWRNLERFGELRSAVREGRTMPLRDLLARPPQAHAGDNLLVYYAQCWALVHFLLEGDGGAYAEGTRAMIVDALEGRLEGVISRTMRRTRCSAEEAPLIAYMRTDIDSLAGPYGQFLKAITARGAGDAIWDGRNPLGVGRAK